MVPRATFIQHVRDVPLGLTLGFLEGTDTEEPEVVQPLFDECGETQSFRHLLITPRHSNVVEFEALKEQYNGDEEPTASKDEGQFSDLRRMT